MELPRGFSNLGERVEETALRELGEETGKFGNSMIFIGRVNPNSAFYTTSGIPLYAAEVNPNIKSKLKPDAKEPILKCTFEPYGEVRKRIKDGQVFCGLSLAGLCLLDNYFELEGITSRKKNGFRTF